MLAIKKNMGIADRIVRVLFAAVVAILFFTNVISGTVALILGGLSAVFLLTSFVGVCPIYLPFRLTTRKKTQQI